MSGAAVVLALASVVRPTSLAAVTSLLTSSRPRRNLWAYILPGLVVSVVLGVVVVTLLHQLAAEHPKGHDGFEIGFGVIFLAAAAWVTIRERRPQRQAHARSPQGDGRSGEAEGKIAKRLRNPTIAGAAIAGILTHAPGAFYIGALDAVIETKPSFVNGVAQVLVYNLIWFAMPIVALVLVYVNEEAARAPIERVGALARRNDRWLGPLLLAGVGAYLLAEGLSKLT